VLITLSILIVVYFAILTSFALLTYGFFWYETANGPHREHLEKLSKGRIGWWIAKGVVTSVISLNMIFISFPLGLWRRQLKPEPDPSCSRPPVILIHGLQHNVSAWFLYRWQLKRKGFHNTYAFGYSWINTGVGELLVKLDGLVTEILGQLPAQRVILIGHSLGGVLARAYVENPSNADKIAAVVTLGSPHQGTKMAVFALGKLARSLTYHGPLIHELEQNAVPADIPCLAIYSPIDSMVLPNEALTVGHPGWSHLEYRPMSHVTMLYHPTLVRLVIAYLQTHAFSGDTEKLFVASQSPT
jgi:triacylglycerol lipase